MAIAILPNNCNNPEKTLDVSGARQDNGAPLIIWELNRQGWEFGHNQEFVFKFHPDGTFSIFPRHALRANRCLTIAEDGVGLWDYEGKDSQKWLLEVFPSGLVFKSSKGSGFLEVKAGSQANGAPVGVYRHEIHPAHAVWRLKISSFRNAVVDEVKCVEQLENLRVKLFAERDAALGKAEAWWQTLLAQTVATDVRTIENALGQVNGKRAEFCGWFGKLVVDTTAQDFGYIGTPPNVNTSVGRGPSIPELLSPPPFRWALTDIRRKENTGKMWDEVGRLRWQIMCWTESVVGSSLGALLIRAATAQYASPK